MHGFPESETVIEADGHVGHGAILHGCRVGRNAMVGMNAVVMDNAVIEAEAIVAALSFVKAAMRVPARHLCAGVPGRIKRELTSDEIAWKSRGTAAYQQLPTRYNDALTRCRPRTAVEQNRPRLGPVQDLIPLYQLTDKNDDPGNES